jgi:methylamine dehydrogenase heavy chain
MPRMSFGALLALGLLSGQALADLESEVGSVAELPPTPEAHWVWVNDVVFGYMAEGRAYLVDGDTGRFLGQLNTGYLFQSVVLPTHGREIYAVETYFSRGTRGDRTDVVTFYAPATLAPTDEVIIPSKKASGVPQPAYYALTDDDRFLLVYNFTPAQSVSVVDLEERKLVGEIETAGCALVYPSGARRFHMLCANGGMLTVTLKDSGELATKAQSDPFFDPVTDPVTEKAVRYKDAWLFVSVEGYVHPVDVSGEAPSFGEKWSLVGDEDRSASWRIGGVQHLAVHPSTGRLYSLMHKGGVDSHKDPGKEIWVYDLATKARVQRIETANLASAIQVSSDTEPLLFTVFIESPGLDVYDARSGKHLRTVEQLGFSPTLIRVPAVRP